jgi:hypothetical protein
MVRFTSIVLFALSSAAGFVVADDDYDMTYFTPGLGSCGVTNTEADPIVAMSALQFTGGPNPCGKKIRITYGGKTAVATVTDKCPPCKLHSIDVSPAVFNQLASPDIGRAKNVKWEFI